MTHRQDSKPSPPRNCTTGPCTGPCITWTSGSSGSCSGRSRRAKRWPAEAHQTAADVTQLSAMIDDAFGHESADVADALRPLYLDYLEKHNG